MKLIILLFLFSIALAVEDLDSEVELIEKKENNVQKCIYECQFFDIKFCKILDHSLNTCIGLCLFASIYIIIFYTPYHIFKYFCRYNKPYEPKSIFKLSP